MFYAKPKPEEQSAAGVGVEKPASRELFSRFAIPALVSALFFLVARILYLSSFPAFLLPEDRKFERFEQQVFCSEMNSNTLNRHYTVADPSQFRLDDNEVTLGDAGPAARRQACAAAENYLSALESFDYDKLSKKHQLTYDIFHDYLKTEADGAAYLLYDEPLSPTLGVQAQLPILFAEYSFRTKGDIEDYLELLAQVPDYFSSILDFEQTKAENGLFMSRDCALEVARQCREFVQNPQDNYLIGTFDDRIDPIRNLTTDEKIAYKSRNQSILSSCLIPAYERLENAMNTLANRSVNAQGLCYYPEGKAYYQYLVRSAVGDDRPIEEIEEAVKVQMIQDFTAIQELMKQYRREDSSPETPSDEVVDAWSSSILALPDVSPKASGAVSRENRSGSDDPAAILRRLRQQIASDFPVLPDVSCEIRYVHESLQNYLSPAFYLTPAIDDYKNNVIYINPAGNYDSLELFTTLAHEGYPGHLYQSVYFSSQQPDLLRSLLDVGGYTEGWATYVEMYAYSLWDEDPLLAALSQRNRSFTLGLASLLDIGIHYRGYSPEQVSAFLEQLGLGGGTAQSLYQSILQSPANYLRYYVGCLNFCELRDEMQKALGDSFSLKEFHRMILETGPAPFYILRRQLLSGIQNGVAQRTAQR